jgi:cell filamentation protein, protein adenylyltransferase
MVASAHPRSGDLLPQQTGPDGFSAFIPRPLPPEPPLDLTTDLQGRIDRANQALGRLDGVTLLLPDPDVFLYSYVRKEAVLSSQIEGTQSSLSDLLLFEHDAAPGVPRGDVEEASNYVAAMHRGMELIQAGMPLSTRVLREVHAVLMDGARGQDRQPGEFRRIQNWLGGTSPATARFVPPPAHHVAEAMGHLEQFINDEPRPTPVLVKAALAHAQFETIHPFLDGNGRLGRLLVTLLLVSEGVLRQPLLYLSLYLKRHRDTYYEHLQRTRTAGDWEAWLRFFLDGVTEVASSTTATTSDLVRLVERDRERVQQLGRASATAVRVHDRFVREIVGRPAELAATLGLSEPPVYQALSRLEDLGIVREITGRRRGRVYAYHDYLTILNADT